MIHESLNVVTIAPECQQIDKQGVIHPYNFSFVRPANGYVIVVTNRSTDPQSVQIL